MRAASLSKNPAGGRGRSRTCVSYATKMGSHTCSVRQPISNFPVALCSSCKTRRMPKVIRRRQTVHSQMNLSQGSSPNTARQWASYEITPLMCGYHWQSGSDCDRKEVRPAKKASAIPVNDTEECPDALKLQATAFLRASEWRDAAISTRPAMCCVVPQPGLCDCVHVRTRASEWLRKETGASATWTS